MSRAVAIGERPASRGPYDVPGGFLEDAARSTGRSSALHGRGERMIPQQRLLLEVSWRPSRRRGSSTARPPRTSRGHVRRLMGGSD